MSNGSTSNTKNKAIGGSIHRIREFELEKVIYFNFSSFRAACFFYDCYRYLSL